MSHTVTIQTRTVTTGNPSVINTGFCRTWTGILKIAQVILGFISVFLVSQLVYKSYSYYFERALFLTIATTFLITSLILVLSCCCSYTTESILSKTIFELLYHAIGFALLLVVSIILLTQKQYLDKSEKIAAIVALVNSILYLFSTIFAVRTTRGI